MPDPFGQNSIQNFMSHMQANPPALTSLYHVEFTTLPAVLSKYSSEFSLEGPLGKNLTYYANEISIPSRQITTGEQKAVGSMYRYPTSTTFSEISMQFTLPRNMQTRTFFERWMNYISNDANQYVAPYENSVCPAINIYKLERGGGGSAAGKPGLSPQAQYNAVTALWKLYNVFPFNISSFNLSNAQSNLINMEVTFYYERYRFYKQGNFPTGSQTVEIDGVPNTNSSWLQQTPTFNVDWTGAITYNGPVLTGSSQQLAQLNNAGTAAQQKTTTQIRQGT